MNINNIITPIGSIAEQGVNKTVTADGDGSFKSLLSQFTDEANKTDAQDKSSNLSLLVGEAESTHQAMIAAERADLSLRLTIQIRNKIIDAYNEIMRMQI